MNTTKKKNKVAITALSSDVFQQAEKVLEVIDENFLSLFRRFDTAMLSRDIIRLEADHYFHKDGFLIPQGATDIQISETDTSVRVQCAFEIPGDGDTKFRFVIVLIYNMEGYKKINFTTVKVFNPNDLRKILLNK